MNRWPIALGCMILTGIGGLFLWNTALKGQATRSRVTTAEPTSYREVVKKVMPAIVSIESKPKPQTVKGQQKPQRRAPRLDGIPEEFRRFFQDMPDMEEDDSPFSRMSFGSGFIVDPKGVVVTNFHVVEGQDRVKITLQDGREFLSTAIQGDKKNDVAIVKFDPKGSLPYLRFGDSDAMEQGDRVLAFGAPFELRGTVTAGIISAKGRDSIGRRTGRSTVFQDYLQTDATINPGNSGGPLVNLDGEVIGINTAIRSTTGQWAGIGYAITSTIAKEITDQLMKDGVVHRGYLGVSVKPLDEDVANRLGIKAKHGVYVGNVFPKTPASKAGMQEGDILMEVNGKPVSDGRELQRVVSHLPVGKPADMQIFRDGKSMTLKVTVEEQPADYGVAQDTPRGNAPKQPETDQKIEKVGLEVADLTPELAKRFGYNEEAQGVLVTKVEPGSIAFEARLSRGVLITKIEKKPVKNAAQVREILEKGATREGILLQIEYPESRGGGKDLVILKTEG